MKEYHKHQTEQIAAEFLAGHVLAFPTDTVYGAGVMYGNPEALQNLKQIKHRPETKAIPMMCASLDQASSFAIIPPAARVLADAFLPGALTLILPLTEEADRQYSNGLDTVAIRIPDADWLLEVMEQLPLPLMVSSANISGQPAALCKDEAVGMLKDLDAIVDGECREGLASTIVDCTKNPPVVVRKGPIDEKSLFEALEKADLFDRSDSIQ